MYLIEEMALGQSISPLAPKTVWPRSVLEGQVCLLGASEHLVLVMDLLALENSLALRKSPCCTPILKVLLTPSFQTFCVQTSLEIQEKVRIKH